MANKSSSTTNNIFYNKYVWKKNNQVWKENNQVWKEIKGTSKVITLEKAGPESEQLKVKRQVKRLAKKAINKKVEQKVSVPPLQLRICFDLSFADMMTPKEFSDTMAQFLRIYTTNRRAKLSLKLHVRGYSDITKQSIHESWYNWKNVTFDQSHYTELFKKDELIYITSESPNVIHSLEFDKCYIIAALTDHNNRKNLCYETAAMNNIKHARLPIDKYLKSGQVLTMERVYCILLYISEGKSWKEALDEAISKCPDQKKTIPNKKYFRQTAENILQKSKYRHLAFKIPHKSKQFGPAAEIIFKLDESVGKHAIV